MFVPEGVSREGVSREGVSPHIVPHERSIASLGAAGAKCKNGRRGAGTLFYPVIRRAFRLKRTHQLERLLKKYAENVQYLFSCRFLYRVTDRPGHTVADSSRSKGPALAHRVRS